MINETDFSRVLGLSAATVHRYLILLQTFYMINFCKPWRSNKEKRLVKTPRPYLIDTGIAANLQGLSVEKMLSEPIFTGHILENFVWQELAKQSTWSTIQVDIYHFRMSTGIEVDIVLEDSMGRVIGIEIKNSDTVRSFDFKGLEYLKGLLGNKFVRGIILYTGNQSIPFGDKMFALPFSILWQSY